jgi:hypothetical protein
MRNRTMLMGVGIGVVVGLLLALAGIALAGSLNPMVGPGTSGSQMYTLEQLYDRLATGAAGTKMAAFTEPSSGPGSTMHTLDDIMAAAPALDETNGAGAADVLSGKTFWGVTSGQWGLRTGTASPASVPRTGQEYAQAFGDDGDLQMGVDWPIPRFTDNSNGTVTDNLTGLIWLKNANCWGTQSWANALTDASGLANGNCGLTDGSVAGDWRLPNVREQQSLIDYGQTSPALPNGHPFTGVQTSSPYWTSTTYDGLYADAWAVDFFLGSVSRQGKAWTTSVWPVRDGE